MASWYGGQRWQGKLTSSGAVYDQDALTAAHATLPIGTRVRVMLAGAGKDVIVTINDRPGTRARVIDLSRAAARQLGILERGIAMVTVSAL
jgi:rare lipoprotein A